MLSGCAAGAKCNVVESGRYSSDDVILREYVLIHYSLTEIYPVHKKSHLCLIMWLKPIVDESQIAGSAARSPPDALHPNCGFQSTAPTKAKRCWIEEGSPLVRHSQMVWAFRQWLKTFIWLVLIATLQNTFCPAVGSAATGAVTYYKPVSQKMWKKS